MTKLHHLILIRYTQVYLNWKPYNHTKRGRKPIILLASTCYSLFVLFFGRLLNLKKIEESSNIAGHCSNVQVIFYTLNLILENINCFKSHQSAISSTLCNDCVSVFYVPKNRLSEEAFVCCSSGCSCIMGVANWSGFCSQRHQSAQPKYHPHICLPHPLASDRANEGSLSQAWSCMSSCGGALQFLFPMLPVSGFLFLHIFIFWLI